MRPYRRTTRTFSQAISAACVEPALSVMKSECHLHVRMFAFGLNAVAISGIHLLNLPARDPSSRLHNTELACMGYFVSKFNNIIKATWKQKTKHAAG